MKKLQVKEALRHAKSLIHFTTDTWHSPNFKELQSFTAHFVDGYGTKRKALLDLIELPDGHAGAKVAPYVLSVLKDYEIKDKLGYVTADNHGANDTLCEALANELTGWIPIERRLRCLGHIINIAVQAFFFAKDKEAVELAIEEATLHVSIDEQLLLLSDKDDTAGWIKISPLQKILTFVRTLRKSERLYNAFKRLASKTIRAPNDTRWNSYLNTFEDAYELRASYTAFILETQAQLSECELTAAEWQLVNQTIAFLSPFKEATKRCEGDYVTLDMVQFHMDSLSDHFKEQKELHKANKSFTESIVTSWYAFDKYYKLIDDSGAYTAAILLHPNRRKSYLQSAWHNQWILPGIERARELWLQYKKEPIDDDIDTSNPTHYERWLQKVMVKQRRGKGAQDEFDRFINAPPDDIDILVLDWWQEESQRRTYPQLSRMAIDILSALAMSAESERVFSGTRRTISWTRASLQTPMITKLECLKHWQKSKLVNDHYEVINDDEVVIESTE
jgi:hypothetical protein